MKPILLIGAGGHARACIDVIECEAKYRIAGLVGLPEELGKDVLGYPIIGTDEDIKKLSKDIPYALVTIGQIKTDKQRVRLFGLAMNAGLSLVNIISPNAVVSKHTNLGKGTIVMHGAIVNAAVEIGDNCIVNTQSLVEHDSHIRSHCHISTASVINSGVTIGEGTFVGSNSCVKQGVRIGDKCVIGMGQRVLHDCESGSWMPDRSK